MLARFLPRAALRRPAAAPRWLPTRRFETAVGRPSRWAWTETYPPSWLLCCGVSSVVVFGSIDMMYRSVDEVEDAVRKGRTGAWGEDRQLQALLDLHEVAEVLNGFNMGMDVPAQLCRMGILRCIASGLHSEDQATRRAAMGILGFITEDSRVAAWLAAQNPHIWVGVMRELERQVPLLKSTWPLRPADAYAQDPSAGEGSSDALDVAPWTLWPVALMPVLRSLANLVKASADGRGAGGAPLLGQKPSREMVGLLEGMDPPTFDGHNSMADAALSDGVLRRLTSLLFKLHPEARPVDVDGAPRWNREQSFYFREQVPEQVCALLAETEFLASDTIASLLATEEHARRLSASDELLCAAWALTAWRDVADDTWLNGKNAFEALQRHRDKEDPLLIALAKSKGTHDRRSYELVAKLMGVDKDPTALRNQQQAAFAIFAGLAWGALRRAVRFWQKGERFAAVGGPRMALYRAVMDGAVNAAVGSWLLTSIAASGGMNEGFRRRCFESEGFRGAVMSVAHLCGSMGLLYVVVRACPYCIAPSLFAELMTSGFIAYEFELA